MKAEALKKWVAKLGSNSFKLRGQAISSTMSEIVLASIPAVVTVQGQRRLCRST